jgi:epoxyqueuosine reductase QueG
MLEEILKAEARRLGFELVGITTPDPPAHLAVFSSWLQAGRHGEMDYLASQRSLLCRSDPRHILPECQSILVLGMRHAHPQGIDPQLQSTYHPKQGHAPSANPPPPPTDLLMPHQARWEGWPATPGERTITWFCCHACKRW